MCEDVCDFSLSGGNMMDPREALKALSDKKLMTLWKKAEPVVGFQRIPDNDYVCSLTGLNIEKSQNGRLQTKWEFQVAEGEEQGHVLQKFDGMETDSNLQFLKGALSVVGVQYRDDDPRSLLKAYAQFIQDCQSDLFIVRLVTRGQYQNIFIQGLANAEPMPADGEVEVEEPEEVSDEEYLPDEEGGEAPGYDDDLPPDEETPDGVDENFTEPEPQPRQRQSVRQPRSAATQTKRSTTTRQGSRTQTQTRTRTTQQPKGGKRPLGSTKQTRRR